MKNSNHLGSFILLAIAFIPNPENKEQVNHIDGIRTNNSLENLEWCTQSENIVHSVRVCGRNWNHVNGEKTNLSKPTEEQVRTIPELCKTKSLKEIAVIFGMDIRSIRNIRYKGTWKSLKLKFD